MADKEFLEKLLSLVESKKASDLHIRAGSSPILRIDGKLIPSDFPATNDKDTENLLLLMMDDKQKDIFYKNNECDFSYTSSLSNRFRVNAFRERNNVHICMRVVPKEPPRFENLNLPPIVEKLCEHRRGMVLITGTTGCGKSTTLAAMVDRINSTRTAHIVTVEDPIEYIHSDKKSIITQRELGMDTFSYHDALRNVVRQDPDVVLIGEMRDLETVSAAITAAQLGHLVLATLHTIGSVQTISRIIDLYPPHQQNQIRYQLADTLRGVVSQRLLPLASGQGRIPTVEVLVVTALIRKMIEENNLSEIVKQIKQGEYYGMQTFNQALIKLYNDKKVTLEDALAASSNPDELKLILRGVEGGDTTSLFR